MKRWFVAAVSPWAEREAYANLVRTGFVAYAPLYRAIRVVRGERRQYEAPVFPGYVFVEEHERWRSIAATRGVNGLLPVGREQPASIAASVIDELRERLGRGEFESEDGDAWLKRLVYGEAVRITSGGLADRVGKFLGRDRGRVVLLVELFNRETRTPVPAHAVAPAK